MWDCFNQTSVRTGVGHAKHEPDTIQYGYSRPKARKSDFSAFGKHPNKLRVKCFEIRQANAKYNILNFSLSFSDHSDNKNHKKRKKKSSL
jgi:hypothetical protein